MAACGSLQHIFDKPLPENPMLDSLSSWKPIQTMKSSIEEAPSFTEIFGELHFQENPDTTASSPINLSPITSFPSASFMTELSASGIQRLNNDNNNNSNNNSKSESNYVPTKQTRHYRHSNSFSSINSDSLSICTEGLGFESSDDVEDYIDNNWKQEEGRSFLKHKPLEYPLYALKRSRTCGSHFPPPISSIGSSGKPWVCFKSYRHNGRFILKEVRVPTQEFLHACREDGRLKLQFIQSDDEIVEEDEEEDDDEENGGRGEGDREYDDDHDRHKNEDEDDYDEDEEENVGIICKKLN